MKYALVLAIGLFVTRTAMACSCANTEDVKSAFKCSSAYFLGLVVEGNERSNTTAKIRVVEGFKGVDSGSIVTVDAGGSCGTTLVTGGLYVIQASLYDGALRTGMCTQTKEAHAAGKTLYRLRRYAWWWRLPFSGHGCRRA